MNDDLIDDTGFDMGLPSPLEMTRQECLLLHSELRDVWAELRRSRRNVARLVQMNSLLADDFGKLRVEHSKVVWELSDIYIKASQDAAKRCNAYAGAYGRSLTPK
ncbi:hypothetical protein [Pseudomonas sp. DSP3-2-2]|uniref:hypothetical protein n=1 Tax=unclassified Pseudomonas TaxID=196821 RepID=UPI003CF29E96